MLNLPVRTPTWQNRGEGEGEERERERNYFSKMQEENNFSLSLLFLTLEPSLVLRER